MNTKEKILLTSLRLFAQDGYEAVSVSQIAGELGMVKSALYKHYKNKQDIFDSIVKRMDAMDLERAKQYQMPDIDKENCVQAYQSLSFYKIKTYTKIQFLHWTQDEFCSLFRKMLTIEQYRNSDMKELYQKYLTVEPVAYMKEIFLGMVHDERKAEQCAQEFYGPIYLLYSLYDGSENHDDILEQLDLHIDRFARNLERENVPNEETKQ